MSAQSGWIEALPLEISGNEKCQKHNIQFDFSHIECIDNYLFLWNDGYTHKILRIHLETKDIQPIIIKQNIKIDSLKIISRNNKQFLLISENKLKSISKLHFINVNKPNQQFSYQSFSSHIIQIEHTSISSNTVYVLTSHNFNIIGLNDECNEIIYHDRVDILGKNLINFCLGIPKHLHDKLFNEYNFYYGFSKFAAYFINKFGEIYVCSPIIPNKFQCRLQTVDTLRYDFMDNNDYTDNDMDDLYDLWLNQTWNVSILNENNNNNNNNLNESILNISTNHHNEPYTTFNAKSQFIYENKAIYRNLYKLNIHQTTDNEHNAICTNIFMLDLDSFFFNERRLKKKEGRTYDDYITNIDDNDDDDLPINILPIFIRIWSDHSMDIVCCTKPIHCSWNLNEYDININSKPLLNENYDTIVIYKNYLDFDDKQNDDKKNNMDGNAEFFMIQKCIQNLDELIIGHTFEGLYRFKMNWLNKIPFHLNNGWNEYLKLLQDSESNIEQIALHKFYMNSKDKGYNAILSDLCIYNNYINNNDELIILDEHLKQIHVFPLYNIDINKFNINIDGDDYKEYKEEKQENNIIDIDNKFDINIMKPFKTDNMKQIKLNLKKIIFDIHQFPANFSLNDPKSLKWFIENIKIKIEKEIFSKIELEHLLMNERKDFIENQMNNYIVPQILMINHKINEIHTNNNNLRNKIEELINYHNKLENDIKNLQIKMKECDNFYNNNNNELIKFKSILQDFQKELNAANYDYQILNQYKTENNKNKYQYQWTKQDMLHLQGKIKNSIKNSNQMLEQIVNGLQQL